MADGTKALSSIHDDFVRRFDLEIGWKDELESKASSLLGFLGVFLAVLVSILSLRPEERLNILPLLAQPLLFQVAAAILLFIVIFGYSLSVGPSLPEVFEKRQENAEPIIAGLTAAYGTSILRNRLFLSKSVLSYQTAVLLLSASLVQLSLNIGSLVVSFSGSPLLTFLAWTQWVPGTLIGASGAALLLRDYLRLREKQSEELIKWQRVLNPGSSPQ